MNPDFLQLRRLWSDIFGDSEGYLDIFFDTYCRSALILTEEYSGSVISALWGLPFDFTGGLKGLYLCGLATRQQWRGKGIMSRLIEQAEEWAVRNKFDFSFLIPADENLRKYYSERGYIDTPDRQVWEVPALQPDSGGAVCRADDLVALEGSGSDRPRMIHHRNDWEAVLRESDISGGKIFCSQICDSGGIEKIEAVAFGEAGADGSPMKIVRVVGDTDASEKLLARIGAGEGVKEPYGMWKPLSQAAVGIEAPDFFLLLD